MLRKIQGGSEGQLAARLADLSGSLAAFRRDLGAPMQDVVLLTMSEFGRTVRQNGSAGTDRGHATCLFVLGAGVRGGKVYGAWPRLAREQLHEGRDLIPRPRESSPHACPEIPHPLTGQSVRR